MKTIKGEELAGKELEVLEDGTLRLIEEKPTRYIPQAGETYYYIDHFGNICNTENNETIDDEWNISHNLVFKTEKECLEYKKFLELLDEYKCDLNWDDKTKNKYYLYYDLEDDEIRVGYNYLLKMQCTFYFKSESDAKEFITKAGKDNIKRYMFDVWE